MTKNEKFSKVKVFMKNLNFQKNIKIKKWKIKKNKKNFRENLILYIK